MANDELLEQARKTLETECETLTEIADRMGPELGEACEQLLAMAGRAIVSGMGKSGAVGRKLAGTLASTGTPAYFMHPAEAVHGDLGMVTGDDVVIFLSNSGETDEVINILPFVRRRGAGIIAICGATASTLAEEADIVLDATIDHEACPLGLAPTASCIASMALGDALAMAVMHARGFTTEDYAKSHPGGALGRKTLWRVSDIMHGGDETPTVDISATVLDALLAMSQAVVRGAVCVTDDNGKMQGFFTDGDFRLLMQGASNRDAVINQPITAVMTAEPTTADPDMLAASALKIMQDREFDNLPVVDEAGNTVGIVDIQDLLKAGIV